MSVKQLIKLRWFHWIIVGLLMLSAIGRNPSEFSVPFVVGTALGAVLLVVFLRSVWSAGGEFKKGFAGDAATPSDET